VHNVSQWPNLRHLGEPLGGAEGLLEAVSFKKVWIEEVSRVPDGSEFQTVGVSTLLAQFTQGYVRLGKSKSPTLNLR